MISTAILLKYKNKQFVKLYVYIYTLKLTPWKQANDILLPCNSAVPPRIFPLCGSLVTKVGTTRPIDCSRGFCQCR